MTRASNQPRRPFAPTVQIDAEDYTPIRFASLLEQEFGGFEPPPGYAG